MTEPAALRYDTGRLQRAHHVAVDLVPSGARVLEMGANAGYMTRCLVKKGCYVVVTDVSQAALAKAAAIADDAIRTDLNQTPYLHLGTNYDVVIWADVLEHLVNPETALRHTRDVLGPNGQVIVSLPNVAHWRMRKDLLLGRFDYTETGILDKSHLHFYTQASFCQLVSSAGFSITRMTPVAGEPPLLHRRIGSGLHSLLAAGNEFMTRRLPTLGAYQFIAVLS